MQAFLHSQSGPEEVERRPCHKEDSLHNFQCQWKPDKDNPNMNAPEGSSNDAKTPASGHPKAILNCRRNSHPFQTRTLVLNTPAKIGRSVARARPSSYNGIFDCKVLSRNHAIIWYEYEAGKFMIQDTKSSNGTFVNNQRLSKGGETSLPREFFSRDVVQFGVDVLENQRKGNEETDNSDESNHIGSLVASRSSSQSKARQVPRITHGCIVATVRLFHPNGKESKSGHPYAIQDAMTPIPQEKICKLELIIHEAQQRESRLHEKLEELQLIVSKLEVACQETLTNRFEETRLLSKISNLEKQTKVMSKAMAANGGKASEKVEAEIQQLLTDIEKLQTAAREIQERQHRKLLESEQKLVEAERVATNLEQEVIVLREQASLTELHLQEMGAKCASYCQTIDVLKSNYHAQLELTQKLQVRMSWLEEREGEHDSKTNFPDLNMIDKYKFITGETDDGTGKKEKGNQEIILEKCKIYDDLSKIEEEDTMKNSEEDKTEHLTQRLGDLVYVMCNGLEHLSNCIGQLEGALVDVERSKKKVEKFCIRSQALALELEAGKIPIQENEKTESDYESEIFKPVTLSAVSNEKLTELEMELEENEELLNQARLKQRESEGKYTKLRCELDGTIKLCERITGELRGLKTLLKTHLKSFEENTNSNQLKISNLESELEKIARNHEKEQNSCDPMTQVKETQTMSARLVSSATYTDCSLGDTIPVVGGFEVKSRAKKETAASSRGSTAEVDGGRNSASENSASERDQSTDGKVPEEVPTRATTCAERGHGDIEIDAHNLGAWEKIQTIQGALSNQLINDATISASQIKEMKNLMNSLAEDLVHLLLREQQITRDNQCLQRKLNETFAREVIPAFGPVVHTKSIILFTLSAIVAYFIYVVFL